MSEVAWSWLKVLRGYFFDWDLLKNSRTKYSFKKTNKQKVLFSKAQLKKTKKTPEHF